MIIDIKSTKFPSILLFHSVDRTWNRIRYKGEYTFLFMLQLVKEAALIICSLILYLYHKYRDEVLRYFTNEALEATKEDT